MDKTLGLYLHMPFCKNKCGYCDFYSVTDCKKCKRYTESICLQMEDYSESAKKYTVDTVFIGGGTPSVLPKKCMLDIFDSLYTNFDIADDAEITMEVNPATVDKGLLKTYRKEGVNRLSIGMQSSSNNELKALSRIHDFEDFEDCFDDARAAKFDNINVDIMYGIPEQTLASLRMTVETVCEFRPEHISLYGLQIEENTPFGEKAFALRLPDEDTEFEMYSSAIEILKANGYEQYEISNFALPGYECKHNLKYWNCEEYLGLGPAAHSYFGGSRFSFKRDIDLYMNAMESIDGDAFDIIGENYEVKPSERMAEYVMLQLRLVKGLNTDKFREIFGCSFERMFAKYLPAYIQNGFMVKHGKNYAFTVKGMYVSNYILSTMLDFDSDISYGIANGSDR